MKQVIKKSIKPLIKITLFGIIFLFIFTLLTYLMKPHNIGLRNMTGLYGEKKNSLDMVYIGGSASFVYWAPLQVWEENGIASYDYGVDTIQPESYKYMIKEVLKTQSPELIVIDARAFEYRNEINKPTEVTYRNVLTGMPLSKNKIDFINDNIPKNLKQDKLSYYFDLIKYHRGIDKQFSMSAIKMMFNSYKNELKGFLFVPKVAQMQKNNSETEEISPIYNESEEILMDLINYLDTTKANYLFVVSPYMQTKEEKQKFNYIEKIVEENQYNFIDSNDYYEEIGIDFNKDFYDLSHVNIFGAEKYTKFLSNYILKNYNIKDHRKDDNYKEWNSLLKNWHARVEGTKKEINKLMEVNE